MQKTLFEIKFSCRTVYRKKLFLDLIIKIIILNKSYDYIMTNQQFLWY